MAPAGAAQSVLVGAPYAADGESGWALGAAARPNVAVSPHYSGQPPTARPNGRINVTLIQPNKGTKNLKLFFSIFFTYSISQ